MPPRFALTVSALTTLMACDPGPIRGTIDSGVNRLEVGMTVEQVNGTIGNPATFSASPTVVGLTCYSYVYDEAIRPRYAHVLFMNGSLVEASDRHAQICDPT